MKRTSLGWAFLFLAIFLISVFAFVNPEDGRRGRAESFYDSAGPVNISNSSSDSDFPVVGVDTGGAAYAVWIEHQSKKNFNFSTNKGGSWLAPQYVGQIFFDDELTGYPALAVASAGICHLTFQDIRTVSYDVFHLLYDNFWGPAANLSNNSGGSGYSSCAVNTVDNSLYVVWTDGTVSQWEVYLKYRNAPGVWSDIQTLPIGSGYMPSLALDASGRAHLAWMIRGGASSSIWYSKNDSPQNPGTWSSPIQIKGDTQKAECFPRIDCDNAGNAYVVWLDGSLGNDEIFLRKVNLDGTPGDEFNVSQSPGASREDALAVHRQSGRIFVAWAEGGDIFLRTYTDRWSEAGNLTNNAAASGMPSLAVDSAGTLHLVYAEMSGAARDIFYLTTQGPTTSTTTSITTTSVPTGPQPPLDLDAVVRPSDDRTTKIGTLAWHRNPDNRWITVGAYRIYRKRAGMPDSDFTFVASVLPETYLYEDIDLLLFQRYVYRMTTVAANGEESDPSASVTEDSVFPPLDGNCRTIFNNSLFRREKINLISWTANILNEGADVVRYNIYRRRSVEEDFQSVLIASVGGSVFTYQDRKLPLKDVFYYVLTAVDADGRESRRSDVIRENR